MTLPTYQLKTFDQLSSSDLYQIMQLRSEVFVLEQNCAYLDLDGLDQQALHLYSEADSCNISSYARIIKPQQNKQSHSSIGRVVVNQKYRMSKIGRALMQSAIKHTLKLYPDYPIKISAQTYLTDFYQNLGFVNMGHFYLEDQIPHQEMLYQPS